MFFVQRAIFGQHFEQENEVRIIRNISVWISDLVMVWRNNLKEDSVFDDKSCFFFDFP